MTGKNSFIMLAAMFTLTVLVIAAKTPKEVDIVINSIAPKTKQYEVKSDIINFDYTQMAYPVGDASVGVKTVKTTPEKRKPAKPLTDKEKLMKFLGEVADGFIMFFLINIACIANYGFFVVLPCAIVYITLMIMQNVKNKKEDKKSS